jgi:hypothetical protein
VVTTPAPVVTTNVVTTNVLPSNVAQSGRGSVTISGLNYNSNDPTPTTSLELAVACSSASWTSATTLLCGAASYRGGTAQIIVSVSGIVGTGVGLFSFDGAHAANASAYHTNRNVVRLAVALQPRS